ncbi:MAG: hypothetical protein Q9219_003378 [cf. Caloplaca sp. 3 TL-2023]
MAGNVHITCVRHASFFILYLLLAAGVFGGTLLHHILWVIRCQDAVDMSHTASKIAKVYASMDVTKTAEFKTSVNTTITQILDDKLPMFISRTCTSLDVFNASPPGYWAFMVFAACYGLSMPILYAQASSLKEQEARKMADSWEEEGAGVCNTAFAQAQERIVSGFVIGCEVAATAWIAVLSLSLWTLIFDNFDYLNLLSLEGLLFSLLPAMGALISLTLTSESRAIQFYYFEDLESNDGCQSGRKWREKNPQWS